MEGDGHKDVSAAEKGKAEDDAQGQDTGKAEICEIGEEDAGVEPDREVDGQEEHGVAEDGGPSAQKLDSGVQKPPPEDQLLGEADEQNGDKLVRPKAAGDSQPACGRAPTRTRRVRARKTGRKRPQWTLAVKTCPGETATWSRKRRRVMGSPLLLVLDVHPLRGDAGFAFRVDDEEDGVQLTGPIGLLVPLGKPP